MSGSSGHPPMMLRAPMTLLMMVAPWAVMRVYARGAGRAEVGGVVG